MVGEAPGASEDAIGEPFVGPAGDLLGQIVKRSLDESVRKAFTNIVCCFPREAKARGDNEPERADILACRPRLIEFANIAQPKLVVCVGALADAYVKGVYSGPRVDIIHPAFILSRMPQAQKGMALNKCVVQIRSAWAEVVCSGKVNITKWEDRDASIKAERGASSTPILDSIPF
jgi:uracil-DNA glycosylase